MRKREIKLAKNRETTRMRRGKSCLDLGLKNELATGIKTFEFKLTNATAEKTFEVVADIVRKQRNEEI